MGLQTDFPLNKLKLNPGNPRFIRDEKYKKLKQSIKESPEFLHARPIVCNPDHVILGGNMRYRAAKELKLKTVPVYVANWDEAKQREFIIKDNVGFGEWDWDILANEWDSAELAEWGLDTWQAEVKTIEDVNKEIDIEALNDSMILKLNYTEEEYWEVKRQLNEIAVTPEQAIWKLLGNE